ncbi:hypothetical protein HNQ80_004109 [Anaerosolibacter carboniphilus]|uniref:Uncharacterized protein n=1 Tax=Anaerosolibacter carboniphilus TaxID=1417629 RepID=A0A841L4C3_9FIRM|nr:hypothetical protein [Anaerosolibacter carboniphilus]MBB6217972.1 hypothetical protein [Anaerosolibacter carboniphilus]
MHGLIIILSFLILLIGTLAIQDRLIKSKYKYGWFKVFIPSIVLIVIKEFFGYKANLVGGEVGLEYSLYSIGFGLVCIGSSVYGAWLIYKLRKI